MGYDQTMCGETQALSDDPAEVLSRIADHKITRIGELLPWPLRCDGSVTDATLTAPGRRSRTDSLVLLCSRDLVGAQGQLP